MFKRLSGYRTYLVGWLWLTATLVALSQGWIDGTQATEWALNALGILGLRAGLNKVAGDETDEDRLADAIGMLLEHAEGGREPDRMTDFEREHLAGRVWDLAKSYRDRPAAHLPNMTGAEVLELVGMQAADENGLGGHGE